MNAKIILSFFQWTVKMREGPEAAGGGASIFFFIFDRYLLASCAMDII